MFCRASCQCQALRTPPPPPPSSASVLLHLYVPQGGLLLYISLFLSSLVMLCFSTHMTSASLFSSASFPSCISLTTATEGGAPSGCGTGPVDPRTSHPSKHPPSPLCLHPLAHCWPPSPPGSHKSALNKYPVSRH